MNPARCAHGRCALLLLLPLVVSGCADDRPSWAGRNQQVIDEHKIHQNRCSNILPDGTAAGTIWVPQYPVSITFGGPNNDVLYMVGESSVWSIQTRVRGFRHPSGMN